MMGDEPDILCWKPASNGMCSSKSAYKMLATEEASNPPSNIPMQVLQILRHVWADKTIQPRVKIFAWRLLRLALGTACRIHRIIAAVDDTCSRCGRTEDDNHLFYFLVAALLGRSGLLRPLALADALPQTDHGLHSQITAILQQGPSQATAGMIFSIMWCLWKARNDHRFNKSIRWLQGFCMRQKLLIRHTI